MLDTFLRLVDRLIQLGQLRMRGRKEILKEVIEPLFFDLQPVVDDYLELFREAKKLAKQPGSDGAKRASAQLCARRELMLSARLKVRGMAESMSEEIGDPRISSFLNAVVAFFYSSELKRKECMSRSAELVELLEYVADHRVKKGELVELIDQVIGKLEDAWLHLAQSYGSARLHCLKS